MSLIPTNSSHPVDADVQERNEVNLAAASETSFFAPILVEQ